MTLDAAPDAKSNTPKRSAAQPAQNAEGFLTGKILQFPAPIAGRSKSELIRTRVLLSASAVIGDILIIIAAFCFATLFRLQTLDVGQLKTLLAVTLPVYLGVAASGHTFSHLTITNFWRSCRKSAGAFVFAATVVLLFVFFLKTSEQFSRTIFAVGTISALLMLVGYRHLLSIAGQHFTGNNSLAQLVIFEGDDLAELAGEDALDARTLGISRNTVDPVNVQRLGTMVMDYERVIVFCHPDHRVEWAHALKSLDIDCQLVVPELDKIAPIGMTHFEGKLALTVSAGPLAWNERLQKRLFDLAVVVIALPLLAIPMILTALAIKLESRGPVLFKQTRIGLGNRPFQILKFRSMQTEQTDKLGTVSTSRADERITRVGAFIRKTSIDELPQILNILYGDMSVVGPRPHAIGSTADDTLFWDIARNYWHRHAMKPGLTGLAQVRGYRGATEKKEDLEGRLRSDLEYRASWSIWVDIKIVLRTFKVLIHRNAF